MREVLPWVCVLATLAIVLGILRVRWLARRIGEEVADRAAHLAPQSPPDPVLLLAELQRLHEEGVVTEEEFEREKARIVGP
ncbi:hypothetical protein HDA40_000807 [Hamadaea flava]|uniref:SHOCT domain-containing protein n=1 Tax=Hamadaea flava TaxID=1742688 RepID=A0ABV8LRR7_9ACTN|nr:SHOCT domain-containing protein [Hamadaea flava]MCP2322300.1 hypothetical protein [Hamadaea flava]